MQRLLLVRLHHLSRSPCTCLSACCAPVLSMKFGMALLSINPSKCGHRPNLQGSSIATRFETTAVSKAPKCPGKDCAEAMHQRRTYLHYPIVTPSTPAASMGSGDHRRTRLSVHHIDLQVDQQLLQLECCCPMEGPLTCANTSAGVDAPHLETP